MKEEQKKNISIFATLQVEKIILEEAIKELQKYHKKKFSKITDKDLEESGMGTMSKNLPKKIKKDLNFKIISDKKLNKILKVDKSKVTKSLSECLKMLEHPNVFSIGESIIDELDEPNFKTIKSSKLIHKSFTMKVVNKETGESKVVDLITVDQLIKDLTAQGMDKNDIEHILKSIPEEIMTTMEKNAKKSLVKNKLSKEDEKALDESLKNFLDKFKNPDKEDEN